MDLTSPTTATITFTSDVTGGYIFLMGGVNAADVNVDATSWTIGSFSESNSGTGFSPASCSSGGSGTVDGFGVFNQTITCFDGFKNAFDTISFDLTNTGGTWASASSVLVLNAGDWDAAIHGFVTAYPAVQSNGALATGFAAEGTGTPPVPEPASLFLLGSGLVGLGTILRRRLHR